MRNVLSLSRMLSALLLLVLAALVAYWTMQLLAPRPVIAPSGSIGEGAGARNLNAAVAAFGRAADAGPVAAPPSNIQVIGVIERGDRGVAIIAVDGQPGEAFAVGAQIDDATKLVAAVNGKVVLEQGDGRRIELDAPQRPSIAVLTSGIGKARELNPPPAPRPPINLPPRAPPPRVATPATRPPPAPRPAVGTPAGQAPAAAAVTAPAPSQPPAPQPPAPQPPAPQPLAPQPPAQQTPAPQPPAPQPAAPQPAVPQATAPQPPAQQPSVQQPTEPAATSPSATGAQRYGPPPLPNPDATQPAFTPPQYTPPQDGSGQDGAAQYAAPQYTPPQFNPQSGEAMPSGPTLAPGNAGMGEPFIPGQQ